MCYSALKRAYVYSFAGDGTGRLRARNSRADAGKVRTIQSAMHLSPVLYHTSSTVTLHLLENFKLKPVRGGAVDNGLS
jgi:hypothetical protein